jgi:hypothetical protein
MRAVRSLSLILMMTALAGGCSPSASQVRNPQISRQSQPRQTIGITSVMITAPTDAQPGLLRDAFLHRCAEITLADGYDSFEVQSYLATEKPGHSEASATIRMFPWRTKSLGRNKVFDARMLLAETTPELTEQ